MLPYLLVFLGAGIGGTLRHGLNVVIARLLGSGFPYGTLTINVVGSLVMGLVVGFFALKGGAPQHLRLFLTTGVLGGFTTFSAFSLETVMLWERGATLLAVVYVVASVTVAVAGLLLGLTVMRQIFA